MLFSSREFFYLFIATFGLYYLPIFKKNQILLLIITSLIFYAYNEPLLLLLLLSSILLNASVSYAILYNSKWNSRLLATFGVIVNLLAIAFFKYSGMLSKTFQIDNSEIGAFLTALPLPLGISFFTFEGISLMVDTYKDSEQREGKSIVVPIFQKHFSNTILFVAFFPHLIAGPILKAHEFYPQIEEKKWNRIKWDKAFRQLLVGYFLKMVVADNLKDQTFWIAYPYFLKYSSETLLFMLWGYSMQIFADFAGYSLIALGLATLLGYELKGNFNFPYISTSFAEFWKRWHISLSSFLREYLYFPLGGNRKGRVRTYINLFITMALGGLWHGAGWSYAIWGTAHGIFLSFERLINDNFIIKSNPVIKIFNWIIVFGLVTIAWLLFKLPELGQVNQYLLAIKNNWSMFPDVKLITLIFCYSSPVIFYTVIGYFKEIGRWHYLKNFEWIMYGLILFLLLTNSGTSSDFIYFQF